MRLATPRFVLASIAVFLLAAAPAAAASALSIGDRALPEGNGGTTDFSFVVTLAPASTTTVTVDYATRDGSALAGSDYVATSGTLTFLPGETSHSVTVQVFGDTVLENNESFFVDLANPVNAVFADSTALGTITNDDVSLSVNDVTKPEGNSGTSDFTFTVTLSASYPLTVTVNYATSDASALAGSDYVATSGTLTFLPGETSHTFTVQIIGDTVFEGNDFFFVSLSSPVNAALSRATGIGTIVNDDVTLSINDVTRPEGNSGTTDFTFTVTLSSAYPLTVTVNYATRDISALAGSDYVAASGSLTFLPGETTHTLTVQVLGDTLFEGSELFFVDLSSPVNAVLGDPTGAGTITNDDVTLSINDVTKPEGNSGTTDFTFTVTLSSAYPLTVTVNYATRDISAIAGSDYVATSGSLTFLPGEITHTLTVPVIGDTVFETNEVFLVDLSSPVNAALGDPTGSGTITNDDVNVSIADLAAFEGQSGTTPFAFTVTLSAAYVLPVSVDFATRDGSALSGSDYLAASGTVTFAPGETSHQVVISVLGDTSLETDETFFVDLMNPVNVSLGHATAVGTIKNDDGTPSLTIDDVQGVEGAPGATTGFVFSVTLSSPTINTVAVAWATANGSATAPADYAPGSGTLTFAPGITQQALTVMVAGDAIFEGNQTFKVTLSNPVNSTLGRATGFGTITDDDPPPSLAIDDVAVLEGDTGAATLQFTVTLAGPTELAAGVTVKTADVSATAGIDYAPASATLTFPPGTASLPFAVQVWGDPDFEIDETLQAILSSPVNATLADDRGTGTILNDEPVCAAPPADIPDLRVQKSGGTLLLTWTDVAGATAYLVFQDSVPNGPAQTVAASVTSGAAGASLPLPAGNAFFLVAGGDSCGIGPRRSCVHDLCVSGARLDSACDPCVAAICAAAPSCCSVAWDATCVASVNSACGKACP